MAAEPYAAAQSVWNGDSEEQALSAQMARSRGAPTSAKMASGALAPKKSRAAPTAEIAALTKRVQENPSRALATAFDPANGHRITVQYNFEIPANASSAPPPAVLTSTALSRMLGIGSKSRAGAGGATKVIVLEARMTSSHSTFPTPLTFSLMGLEGRKDVITSAVHRTDGTSFTATVLPGAHHVNKRLHQIAPGYDPKQIVAYHNSSVDEHTQDVVALGPDSDFVMVKIPTAAERTASNGVLRVYDFIRMNNKHLKFTEDQLRPVQSGVNMCVLPRSQVTKVLDDFNQTVISTMPMTNFADVEATIGRLSDGARHSGAVTAQTNFGDLARTPGVTQSQREQAKGMAHAVSVEVEYTIVHPTMLAAAQAVVSKDNAKAIDKNFVSAAAPATCHLTVQHDGPDHDDSGSSDSE
jgi:hypothetical protein